MKKTENKMKWMIKKEEKLKKNCAWKRAWTRKENRKKWIKSKKEMKNKNDKNNAKLKNSISSKFERKAYITL